MDSDEGHCRGKAVNYYTKYSIVYSVRYVYNKNICSNSNGVSIHASRYREKVVTCVI